VGGDESCLLDVVQLDTHVAFLLTRRRPCRDAQKSAFWYAHVRTAQS
jgi:hypothetical protein